MRPTPYDHLVDVPYTDEHNCRWVCVQALVIGDRKFHAHEIPSPEEAEEALRSTDVGHWRKVGECGASASKAMDVIYGLRDPTHPYLAVVIDPVGRIALTSTAEVGRSHRMRVDSLRGIQAVYRRSA